MKKLGTILLASLALLFFSAAYLVWAQDNFPQAAGATPVSVQNFTIHLYDHVFPETTQFGTYEVYVNYSDGSTKRMTGNLVPHLTAAQISSVQTFLNQMRAKAEAEILP